MRQALIVENPKWERFSDVREKFKALSGSAILIERGRVKEKRPVGGPSKVRKAEPDSPEALAADLAKQGAKPDEIATAVKKFKTKLTKAATAVALFLLCGFSAFAQADITGYLPTTQLTALSTNTPGAGLLGWNIDQVAVFQLTCTTTNARSAVTHSNIVIYLDTVLQGSVFKTNAYTLTFESTTNASTLTSFAKLTNTIGGNLRIGNTCNANTNHVLINNLVWRLKE